MFCSQGARLKKDSQLQLNRFHGKKTESPPKIE